MTFPPSRGDRATRRTRTPLAMVTLLAAAMIGSTLTLVPAAAAPGSPAASFSDVGLAGPVPADRVVAGQTAPYSAAASPGLATVAAPAAVGAVARGDGAALVSWAVPTDPAALAGVDAVWVQTYTAQGSYLGEQVAAPTATSAQVTGLVPAHDYLFGVLTESAGSFSGYRFSPQVGSTGYTGTAGVALPVPILPDPLGPGSKDIPIDSLVSLASQVTKDQLRATVGAAQNVVAQADPVLGREAWQSCYDIDAGSGQRLSLNVANGNAVLTSVDQHAGTSARPALLHAAPHLQQPGHRHGRDAARQHRRGLAAEPGRGGRGHHRGRCARDRAGRPEQHQPAARRGDAR